jgi:hypothetical protein
MWVRGDEMQFQIPCESACMIELIGILYGNLIDYNIIKILIFCVKLVKKAFSGARTEI